MGDDQRAPVFGKGEFWGADSLFAAMTENGTGPAPMAPAPVAVVARDSCEIYSVPLKLVSRIPVVRWKLFEAFRSTQYPHAAPRYRGTPR